MELIEILELDEVGKLFTTQFKLSMMWYDYRVKLFNMKRSINMNTLTNAERNMIWVPRLVFANTESKTNTVNDGKGQIVARRDSNFTYRYIMIININIIIIIIFIIINIITRYSHQYEMSVITSCYRMEDIIVIIMTSSLEYHRHHYDIITWISSSSL